MTLYQFLFQFKRQAQICFKSYAVFGLDPPSHVAMIGHRSDIFTIKQKLMPIDDGLIDRVNNKDRILR